MKSNQDLLRVKDLSVRFTTEEGMVTAVNKISFSLKRGETVGIVGESGSGKSVTSLSIMRLLPSPPAEVSGSLTFVDSDKELDILKLQKEDIRNLRGNRIAMIFQEPMTSLNPVHTCGRQVAEALIRHRKLSGKEARIKTVEIFKEVELPRPEAIFDSYPHELSGGQKQRVMIAMAISCEPDLLIADEPTTALDVTVQKKILELLVRLQKKNNMAIIFITHDLGVVAEIADRAIVMYQGNIVEQGSIEEIFVTPKHPYTRGLLACRPTLTQRLKRLPTVKDFMQIDNEGNVVEVEFTGSHNLLSDEERKQAQEKIFSEKPILEIEGLKTWFPIRKGVFKRTVGHVKAVDDVSFSVYKGETLGLVGESGCGKTTLGRSILRLVEPSAGKVAFYGDNIALYGNEEMRKLRKKMQLIFQDPYSSLNPRLTIGNALAEPLQVYNLLSGSRARKERVTELLEKVGLKGEHYNRYPHEFSGGQRQRINIARALILEPEFIICDESVSALDVSVQAQVLNLLNDLKAEFGLTYIFISHDLSVVKYMSDRMVVMNKGKIEEMGDADEIYANPGSEYTKKLIEAIPTGEEILGKTAFL